MKALGMKALLMKALGVAALLLPMLAAQAGNEGRATVTRVSDGDTVWLRPDDGGKPFRLRLQGIDAPERCQPWGEEAKAALGLRVLNQPVRFTTRGKDDYQRVLGNIFLGEADVSAWLVSQGHAWSYRYRRSAGPYAGEEQQARAARRGLFGQEGPMQPSVFRQLHGPCD